MCVSLIAEEKKLMIFFLYSFRENQKRNKKLFKAQWKLNLNKSVCSHAKHFSETLQLPIPISSLVKLFELKAESVVHEINCTKLMIIQLHDFERDQHSMLSLVVRWMFSNNSMKWIYVFRCFYKKPTITLLLLITKNFHFHELSVHSINYGDESSVERGEKVALMALAECRVVNLLDS